MMLRNIRQIGMLSLPILLAGAMTSLTAQAEKTLVVTSTNAAANQLLVYSSEGSLLQTLATNGTGGASGNAGGIAASHDLVAVVNTGSQTVAIFEREDRGLRLVDTVGAASNPLSVAFGHGHLYILGTTTIESHPISNKVVSQSADGTATLLHADGSAAQVGVLPNELIISEKSNAIETIGLSGGEVVGAPALVANIPANVNAPFGLVTRGADAYVTIAHANEISLVRHDTVLTVTGSGTQSAPCWVALEGSYLFSANSPSHSVSRYVVYGEKIVQDAAVIASFTGSPTDIAATGTLAAVVDGSAGVSRLSIFGVDGNGNFTLIKANTIPSAANGVVILQDGE